MCVGGGGGEGCVGGETTHCQEMLQKMRIWRPESGAKSSGRTDVFFFLFFFVQTYRSTSKIMQSYLVQRVSFAPSAGFQ